jgi:flagellar export protein FliJ
MAFQFSLQSVLRLRAAFERMERLRLQALAAAVARLRQEVVAIDRAALQIRQDTQARLAGGVAAVEIHFAMWTASAQRERKRLLLAQIEELEKKRVVQEQAYVVARQKLEIAESLREGQWQAYRVEQARREQRAADEMFLMRSGRGVEQEIE